MPDAVNVQHGPFPGVLGPHTFAAVQRLKDGKPGDSFTPEEMEQIIGKECGPQTPGYGNVYSAIKRVEAEYNVIWRWVSSEKAWRCLNDSERQTEVRGRIKRSARHARRTMRIGMGTDRSKLTPEQTAELNIDIARAGMIQLCGSASFRNRLIGTVTQNAALREPDPAKLVELMQPKENR